MTKPTPQTGVAGEDLTSLDVPDKTVPDADKPNKDESGSDNDNERPVREKLKKTSIAALPKYGVIPTEDISSEENDVDCHRKMSTTVQPELNEQESSDNTSRGRPGRKRSHDPLTAHDEPNATALGTTE